MTTAETRWLTTGELIKGKCCDACLYETDLKLYPLGGFSPGDPRYRTMGLCFICANTMIGEAARPHGAEYGSVLRTIGFVVNTILAAINELRRDIRNAGR